MSRSMLLTLHSTILYDFAHLCFVHSKCSSIACCTHQATPAPVQSGRCGGDNDVEALECSVACPFSLYQDTLGLRTYPDPKVRADHTGLHFSLANQHTTASKLKLPEAWYLFGPSLLHACQAFSNQSPAVCPCEARQIIMPAMPCSFEATGLRSYLEAGTLHFQIDTRPDLCEFLTASSAQPRATSLHVRKGQKTANLPP